MGEKKPIAKMNVLEFDHAATLQERGRAQQKTTELSCDRNGNGVIYNPSRVCIRVQH